MSRTSNSAYAHYVTFSSAATNLVPGDTNDSADIFVHNRQTGQTVRVSIASDGTPANDGSWWESISANGRYVAFASNATNLVPGDTNGVTDIFVHDRSTSTANSISGHISDAINNPISGVTISTNTGQSATTNANGDYIINDLPAGTYTLTPTKIGYTFSPPSRTVTVPPHATTQNFIVFLIPKTIDLSVSIYRTITSNSWDREAFQEIFNCFADAIFEMSNGQHRIGTITAYHGSSLTDVDVLWNAREWPQANTAGYGVTGRRVWMGDVFSFSQQGGTDYYALGVGNRCGAGYVLAHEWGHYYYGLYDEYQDPKCDSKCSEDITNPRPTDTPVHNSVMNSPWNAVNGNYNWLNFSVAKNINGDTAQRRVYAASGWETLARPPSQDPRGLNRLTLPQRTHYPELVIMAPASGADSSLELPNTPINIRRGGPNVNVEWIEVDPPLPPPPPPQPDVPYANIVTTADTEIANSSYWGVISSLLGPEITYPQPMLLVASVYQSDPIAQATLAAEVETPIGDTSSLSLLDDGLPPDALADDGFYSGYLTYQQTGTYTVTVTFDNESGEAFFTQLSAAPAIGPNGETFVPTFEPVGENFIVTAMTTLRVNGVQPDDHGDTPDMATPLAPNNENLPGRIDRSGDLDVFKVMPSETGRLAVRISNLALDMQPRIRILAANGVTVLGDFSVSPTATAYFFTWLDATARQPFYIELSHSDNNAATGYYDVSVGPPLSNEQNDLYLPIVIR